MNKSVTSFKSSLGDEPFEEGGDDRFSDYCQSRGWEPCGLNADWALVTFQINPAGQGRRYGLLAMDEGAGSYLVCFARNPDSAGVHSSEEAYFDDPDSFLKLYSGPFEGFVAFCEAHDRDFQAYTPPKTSVPQGRFSQALNQEKNFYQHPFNDKKPDRPHSKTPNKFGRPVDEKKWSEAKIRAAEEGHSEDYGYIMTIYKSMMGVKG